MAKAYLIGGTPRCGKTSVALSAIKLHPMFATSSDSIRYILRNTLRKDQNLDLFAAQEKFTEESIQELCSTDRTSEIIDWQNRESRVVWRSVKDTIEGFIAEGLDVLVEGVAILPEFVLELNCDYSAVFIGNTSTTHKDKMLEFARSGEYDWMAKFDDETIVQFGKFTNDFSHFIKTEAKLHGFDYFDTGTDNFHAATQDIAKRLLRNKV